MYDFKSEYAGVWQTVPNDVITRLKKDKIKLVIKFGMNLLRISEELEEFDIMSFHHGDPKEFRGRPAGFYEIHLGSKKIGAIVQILSNNLDGGKIAAKGFSSIYLYSYKKTLISLYKNSSYLLKAAIANYKNDNIYAQMRIFQNINLGQLSIKEAENIFEKNLNLINTHYNNRKILLTYLELSKKTNQKHWIDFINLLFKSEGENINDLKKKLSSYKKTKDENLLNLIKKIQRDL